MNAWLQLQVQPCLQHAMEGLSKIHKTRFIVYMLWYFNDTKYYLKKEMW